MLKKIIVLLYLLILLTACVTTKINGGENIENANSQEESAEETITPEPEDKPTSDFQEEQIANIQIPKIYPYYENGDVDFSGIVKFIDGEELLSEETIQEIIDLCYGTGGKYDYHWKDAEWIANFYTVGTINKEPYKGKELIMAEINCDGPCFINDVLRFAWDKDTKELVYLPKNSTLTEYTPDYINPLMKNADYNTMLNGVNPPQKIKIPDSEFYLELDQADSMVLQYHHENVVFTDENYGEIYDTKTEDGYLNQGCLYLRAPDGSLDRFAYKTHFFDDNGDLVTWDKTGNQTNLKDDYGYPSTGCMGMSGGCYIVADIDDNELIKVAESDHGIVFYESKNPEYLENKKGEKEEKVNSILSRSYDNYTYRVREETLAFEDYVKTKPLLFWKDPIGRWSYIQDFDSQTLAECAKPVIYLYPEEETKVNVKVDIGEFTKTIPDYGVNGWTVIAYPDGEIYNIQDGEKYPYLFWEGHSDKGIEINNGFVIKRETTSEFLDKSLTKLGLNEAEKADFIEFWEPKMLSHQEPYLFVSFLGTKDFNKIAPLTITPNPDTLIRVFMYYEPIWDKYSIQEQQLSCIDRKGFTVIEWGGTSPAL